MVIARTVNMLHAILEQARGFDDVELLFTKGNDALTRFMNNHVHQSTEVAWRNLRIRVLLDGRCGVVETDRFDQDSLAAAIERAGEIARAQPIPATAAQLVASRPMADSTAWHETTAAAVAFDRAQIVKQLGDIAKAVGAAFSGAISTSENTTCIVNTRGTEAYQESTQAELNLLALRGELSGYSYWIGGDLSALPLAELAQEALSLTTSEEAPERIEPGVYPVVLDHYAVGMMIGYLGTMGFGAKQYIEGRSFMTRRMGKRVASTRITIRDDARNPAGLPSLFDSEGVVRRPVDLIQAGAAVGVVTDSVTARALEWKNSGHALPMPNSEGPAASHLFVEPGKSTVPRMIASIKRGIYVRKFHYVNVVDPMTSLLTGMTKDGTFLIEDGKLVRPLRNLRFTQDVLAALKSCSALSSASRLVEGVHGPVHAPAMLIKKFHFTGVGEE